jgi:hypothetical protein
MATFDGATFKVRTYSIPWESGVNFSERSIPGGDITILDIGGKKAEHVTITAKFDTDAERETMRGKASAGTSGTLAYVDGTFTATLVTMRRSARYPNDQQIADLEFILS